MFDENYFYLKNSFCEFKIIAMISDIFVISLKWIINKMSFFVF